MNELSESFITFIEQHAKEDTVSLRLKMSGKKSVPIFPLEEALTQIEARQKTRRKLPTFIANREFMFPSIVAAEQATNEAVARYHASLVEPATSLLDMTAGLGIDDLTFAQSGVHVTSCEIEEYKCTALRHNSRVMGVEDNLEVVCTDSVSFLANSDKRYDTIFADPARRGSMGNRVHALSDCEPNILDCMQDIRRHTSRLLVKCSPLLDLTFIKNTVEDLKHIHVVCFKGECKEVLIEICGGCQFEGTCVIDLDMNGIISKFISRPESFGNTAVSEAGAEAPHNLRYLYEPNAGIMKTGDWKGLTLRFPDLKKADPNTHIFLSDTLYTQFPGRILNIERVLDKKTLKAFKGEKANVTARNHPLTAQQLSSKYGITPGSDRFIYAFRCAGKPVILLATTFTQDPE